MSKIKTYRIRKMLTQNELAKQLNVSRTAVAMWESNAALPQAEKLPRIAAILGCTVDELLAVDDI